MATWLSWFQHINGGLTLTYIFFNWYLFYVDHSIQRDRAKWGKERKGGDWDRAEGYGGERDRAKWGEEDGSDRDNREGMGEKGMEPKGEARMGNTFFYDFFGFSLAT